MNTHVQRWGNSLAIRIPKAFAEETGLQANDEIEITLRDGQIVLTPRKTQSYSLEELLESVTPENRPGEWDMGSMAYIPDRGDLVWLTFNPQAGHEQSGRRPALTLSPIGYNRKVGLALFCPISTQVLCKRAKGRAN